MDAQDLIMVNTETSSIEMTGELSFSSFGLGESNQVIKAALSMPEISGILTNPGTHFDLSSI